MITRVIYKNSLCDFQPYLISIFFVIYRHEKEKIYITNKYINNKPTDDKPINDKPIDDDSQGINDNNDEVKQEKKLL